MVIAFGLGVVAVLALGIILAGLGRILSAPKKVEPEVFNQNSDGRYW